MIKLETMDDVITVVNNWLNDNKMFLEHKRDTSESGAQAHAYNTALELLEEFPITTGYFINETVMTRFVSEEEYEENLQQQYELIFHP